MTAYRRNSLRAKRAKYNLVHPELGTITRERAEEIWNQRSKVGNVRLMEVGDTVTPAENKIIRFLWDQMPGSSCWMSAFFVFLNQEPNR